MPRYVLTESRRVFDAYRAHLPGGVHYNFRGGRRGGVIPFTNGAGSRLWDYDGNEYLDLFCQYGASMLGHRHEGYTARLQAALGDLLMVEQTGIERAVCEKLLGLYPGAEMVRFGLSGTETIQQVVRLARAVTGRNRILRFQGHYHGHADNVMGGRPVSSSDPRAEPYPDDPLGTEGRACGILEQQSYLVPWNDLERLERVLTDHGHDVALVIMEPVCMNGGGILPRDGYLEGVRALCDRHGIVLAFDEIITGLRMGMSGCASVYGVRPDITILGKALGGGAVPVSAILGGRAVMEPLSQQRVIHAGTFAGYSLGLAAVLATLETLEEDPDGHRRMGALLDRICDALRQAAREQGIPMVIQGFPAARVYHVADRPLQSSGEYEPSMAFNDAVVRMAFEEHGILIAPTSRMYGNILLKDADVAFFEERIPEIMASVGRAIG